MEEPMSDLYAFATEYIETLDRDKRIVAARYISKLKESPNTTRDMGFLQFVEMKLNSRENKS